MATNIVTEERIDWSTEELVDWINMEMQCEIENLHELKTCAIYCQLVHRLYPDAIDFARVKLITRHQADFEDNFFLLDAAFKSLNVRCRFLRRDLIKGRGHTEFLNWLRHFYEQNNYNNFYDAVVERGGNDIGLDKNSSPRRSLFQLGEYTESTSPLPSSLDTFYLSDLSLTSTDSDDSTLLVHKAKKRCYRVETEETNLDNMFKQLKLEVETLDDAQLGISPLSPQFEGAFEITEISTSSTDFKLSFYPKSPFSSTMKSTKTNSKPDAAIPVFGLSADKMASSSVFVNSNLGVNSSSPFSGLPTNKSATNSNSKPGLDLKSPFFDSSTDNLATNSNSTLGLDSKSPFSGVPSDELATNSNNVGLKALFSGIPIENLANNSNSQNGIDLKSLYLELPADNLATNPDSKLEVESKSPSFDLPTDKSATNSNFKHDQNSPFVDFKATRIKTNLNGRPGPAALWPFAVRRTEIPNLGQFASSSEIPEESVDNTNSLIPHEEPPSRAGRRRLVVKSFRGGVSTAGLDKTSLQKEERLREIKSVSSKHAKKYALKAKPNKNTTKHAMKVIPKKSTKDEAKTLSKDVRKLITKNISKTVKDDKGIGKHSKKSITKDINKNRSETETETETDQDNDLNDKFTNILSLREENSELESILFEIYQVSQVKGEEPATTVKNVEAILKKANVSKYLPK